MSTIRSEIESLSNRQTVFLLEGLQQRLFPDLNSEVTIPRREIDLDVARSMLAHWAETVPNGEALVKELLDAEARLGENREVLADVGLAEGLIAITAILGVVYAQMHADSIRQTAPDKETRPDGTTIERKLFSITDVLEKAKQLVSKDFLEKLADLLKSSSSSNP